MAELDDRSRRPVPSFTLPAPRRSATGLVVSVLVHLGVLALVAGGLLGGREMIRALGGGAGLGEAGGGGGGGGDRVSYIDLPAFGAAAPQSAAPVPEEVAKPEPPVEQAPVPTPVAVMPPTAVAVAPGSSATTGQGTGTGPGLGPGTGGGSGGGSGGGVGPGIGSGTGPGTGGDSAGITPPQLQFWVPPAENAPKSLRGRPIIITIWVTANGMVDRFTTDPAIEDKDYRDKLADLVVKTRFKPARTREGIAVPGVTQLTITLGKK